MTATIMIHDAMKPFARKLATDDGRDCSSLNFPMSAGGYVAIFMPIDVAQRIVAAWGDVSPSRFSLLAFVVDVRDYKPEVISGRSRDPQDDVPDLIEADTFYAFQADAEALIPKSKKEKAA